MIQIKDNFLNKKDFKTIKEMMESNTFPWYFNNYKIDPSQKNKDAGMYDYQFVHNFFLDNRINSNAYNVLEPIHKKLKPKFYIRIKANLNSYTHKPIKHAVHTDQPYNCKAAIFYINSNNGYTYFNKEKVKPKENRIVFFNGNVPHQAQTCTDEKFKLVINFNYQ